MRTHRLLALALLATTFVFLGRIQAQNAPDADKTIEASLKTLRAARDATRNPADREKLTRAITALEQVAAKKDDRKIYTRREFEKLVVGKTREQVKQLLGKPDRTIDIPGDLDYPVGWCYSNLTRDPDAEKIDPAANILFDRRGVAVSVDYIKIPF